MAGLRLLTALFTLILVISVELLCLKVTLKGLFKG